MNGDEFLATYTEEIYSIKTPVTVVIGVPWNQISEEQRVLLTKILTAVKLSLDSVRLVHQTTFDASAWTEKPSRVIAFINAPKGLTPYEVTEAGETSIVFSAPLSDLISAEPERRKLWNALRSLFPA